MKPKSLITPVGRASYPALWTPRAFAEGQEKKFEITLVWDEGVDLGVMVAAADDCARQQWGREWPDAATFRDSSTLPKWMLENHRPFKRTEDGLRAAKFTRKTAPGVVDEYANLLAEESGKFYAGCRCRISFSVYAYDNQYGRGVKFGLGNVQKTGDDEPFGAMRINAEDEFDAVETAPSDDWM